MIADRPALGAVLRRADVQRRRLFARLAMRDSRSRYQMVEDLSRVVDGVRVGRRWDLIASDLHELSCRAADTPRRQLAMDVAA